MRKCLFVAYLAILLSAICCIAGPSSPSPRLKLMRDRLARREAVVNGWASQASQQVAFALSVGLLGIVIGAAQASARPWVRGLTVGAGLSVSALTLTSKILYPADYRTLERSVQQATPIIEDLQGIITEFDPAQTLENQLAVEAEFKTKCGRIDLIGQKLLGVDPPSQGSVGASLFWVRAVHAQSPQKAPAWVVESVGSDRLSTYFVGLGKDKSLSAAKAASFDNAVHNCANWLRGDQASGSLSEPPQQLLDFVKQAVEAADSWFAYDRNASIFRYYTRLRLTNEFRRYDLKDLPLGSPDKGEAVSQPQPRTHTNKKDGLLYVWIPRPPSGKFMMGCSPGDTECGGVRAAHKAQIAKGFWLGLTEVTQAAWKRVMSSDPSFFKGDELPVEMVNWNEARAYCSAIGGRLPTETEWEYAARGGNPSARYGPLDAVAWYEGNSGKTTHPVARKKRNAFGLYDMLGNVWEWTADAYDASGKKTLRGGSWHDVRMVASASYRGWSPPETRDSYFGFRCVEN